MEKDLKDTLEQVAEYSNIEKKNLKKKMIENSIAAAILLLFAAVLHMSEGFGGFIPERPIQNLTYFAIGMALAILVMNALYLCGALDKIRAWKLSHFSKNRNK